MYNAYNSLQGNTLFDNNLYYCCLVTEPKKFISEFKRT